MTTETDKTERERFEAWWDNPGPCDEALKGVSWQAWQARAALDTGGVPEGWMLVPVEPTQEMFDAGMKHRAGHPCNVMDGYTAMLAVAPQPPAPFPAPGRKDGEEPRGECRTYPGETCDICGAVWPPASASAGKVEPAAWQWRAVEGGNARTAWYPDDAHGVSLWEEYARGSGGRCVIEKRPLYTAPPAHPDAYHQGAEEMRERCANAVRGWRARPNDCDALGFMCPETGARECALEVRGHDCICDAQYEAAEEIERVIRAIPLPGDKEG